MRARTRTHPNLAVSVCLAALTCALAPALETDGKFTEYSLPNPGSGPTTISIAPDGNLWFTEGAGNRIKEFDLPNPGSQPRIIAVGADKNLWFTEHPGNRIGRLTPAGVLTEFPIPTPNCQPRAIALAADGNLWFVELTRNGVARITTAGKATEFQIPSPTGSPINISVGPDRNIWYTKQSKPGRVAPNGGATGLTAGSDRQPPDRLTGKLWFTGSAGNKIAYLNFE